MAITVGFVMELVSQNIPQNKRGQRAVQETEGLERIEGRREDRGP
jgi:hypothetical protein